MRSFALRSLFCLILFTSPIILVIVASREPAAGLMILMPVIGLIPALIMALIFFVPIERLTARLGLQWTANLLVPLMGAVGAIASISIIAILTGAADAALRNAIETPYAVGIWIVAGAVWGIIWRVSSWAERFFFSQRSKKR